MTTTTITTAPDTAPGQLTHSGLGGDDKVELKYSRSPIKISAYDLIRWWDQGVINTSHFIRFALMVERVGHDGPENFDIQKFCEDWQGTKNNGDPRMLSPKQVLAEIQHLQQKGAAHVETSVQMSLDLMGGHE